MRIRGFLEERTTSWRGKFVTAALCSHYWFICLPFGWSPVPSVEWRAFEGAHVRGEVLTIIQLPSWAERVWKVLLILNEFDERVYIYDTKACWVSHLSTPIFLFLSPRLSYQSDDTPVIDCSYWQEGALWKNINNSFGKWLNGAWLRVCNLYVFWDLMLSHKVDSR